MDGIVTIAWNDGSGDNLYLSLSGDSVEVTSDANWSGEERSKTLTFATTVGVASAQLMVTQGVGEDGVIIVRNDVIITYDSVVPLYKRLYSISFSGDWTPTEAFNTAFELLNDDGDVVDEATSDTTRYRVKDGASPDDALSQTYCFAYSPLVSIVLPDGLTTIGNQTFRDCVDLTNVTIPNGVMSIGASAFRGCTVLETSVIPSSVTTLGSNIWRECVSLANIYSYPMEYESVGTGLLQNGATTSGAKTLYVPTDSTYYENSDNYFGSTMLTTFGFTLNKTL